MPLAILLALLAVSEPGPSVWIVPPDGARFLPGQRFDLRVEFAPGENASLTAISVALDGAPMAAEEEGFTLRSLSFPAPGRHTIEAVATDSGGRTARSEAHFEIVVPGTGGAPPARKLIFFLGDGMGTAHRTAARIYLHGVVGGRPGALLAMDRMPGTGLVTTSSLDALVTDSSAGMSAFWTGNKARNGEEGVFHDRTPNPFDNPRVENLAEYLHRRQGKSLGIVTTADLADATPAATGVHTSNRRSGTGICDRYLEESEATGLVVLLGGGRRWFVPARTWGSARNAATDASLPEELATAWGVPSGVADPGRDLVADFRKGGFASVSTRAELLGSDAAGAGKLLGVFAWGNMSPAYDRIAGRRAGPGKSVVEDFRAPDQPMLEEMLEAALRVLRKDPDGFVLVVEGAGIDKQSHAMDGERAIWETIELDRAVGKALEFARKDGETLVLVTADHETSGFSILGPSRTTIGELRGTERRRSRQGKEERPAASGYREIEGFDGVPLAPDGWPAIPLPDGYRPVLIGFGASADRYETWLPRPRPTLDTTLPPELQKELEKKGYPRSPKDQDGSRGSLIPGQVSGWGASHTPCDLPISAYGGGNEAWRAFSGVMDSTDVFFRIAGALLGSP